MLAKLKKELPRALSSLANSLVNSHFRGKALISATTFACDHIQHALEAQFPPPNKLPRIYLPREVEVDEVVEDVTILGPRREPNASGTW